MYGHTLAMLIVTASDKNGCPVRRILLSS